MAYIGNIPAESYASFEKQVFTIVNSQTAYTLTHAVTNENDIRLVVNNVVQEPGSGKAYTAANTTLTLSAALVNGTDEMYCVYLGRALQTVNPPNASVGNSQTAPTIITGQTAETSIATDDTVLIHDTSASALRKMTRANFVSGIGGTNTPAFLANLSADQTISNNTYNKLTMNTEIFDDGGCFDSSSNYRFTPTTAGKYYVYVKGRYISSADYDNNTFNIWKNGSNYAEARNTNRYYDTCFIGVIIDFNGSSDYVEAYTQHTNGGNLDIQGGTTHQGRSEFGAYKIIQ